MDVDCIWFLDRMSRNQNCHSGEILNLLLNIFPLSWYFFVSTTYSAKVQLQYATGHCYQNMIFQAWQCPFKISEICPKHSGWYPKFSGGLLFTHASSPPRASCASGEQKYFWLIQDKETGDSVLAWWITGRLIQNATQWPQLGFKHRLEATMAFSLFDTILHPKHN